MTEPFLPVRPTRRAFLRTGAGLMVAALAPRMLRGETPAATVTVAGRIHGMMLGGALGDALGGPIEFQARERIQQLADPPKVWSDDEVLDAAAIQATAARLRLRSYESLRPRPESYGQWNPAAAPGTITDDTRHKLVLLHALRVVERAGRWPLTVKDLAQAYLDWPGTEAVAGRAGYTELAADWLEEWQFAARWVLGEREPAAALPPERMWQGLPTCCGQMTLPPLAAVFAGAPDRAYRAAFQLAFFDNGFGKDLNAALIAGLAEALVTPLDAGQPAAAWERVFAALRGTDPYRHGKIRWTERQVDRWLNRARNYVQAAEQRPARLFAALEREFGQNSKWEAQVPVVVAFACLELAGYDPRAALQLCLEWGHDSDSYASLLGAFLGALHGPEVFPEDWRDAVIRRLSADHGVDLEAECRFLDKLRIQAQGSELVR